MLAHDLANKLAAVVSHCDLLQLEVEPGCPSSQHAEKIRLLAIQMADMLRTRECEREPRSCDDLLDGEKSLVVGRKL